MMGVWWAKYVTRVPVSVDWCRHGRRAGTCPFGPAWAAKGSTETLHDQQMECSNVGVCDRKTAKCRCPPGFGGIACSRGARRGGANLGRISGRSRSRHIFSSEAPNEVGLMEYLVACTESLFLRGELHWTAPVQVPCPPTCPGNAFVDFAQRLVLPDAANEELVTV